MLACGDSTKKTNLPLVSSSIALVPHLPAFIKGERAVVFSINHDLFRFPFLLPLIVLPLHYVGEVVRYCAPFGLIFHHLCIYRLPALRTLSTSSSTAFLRYLHCAQMSTVCSVGLEVESELLYIPFPLLFSCFNTNIKKTPTVFAKEKPLILFWPNSHQHKYAVYKVINVHFVVAKMIKLFQSFNCSSKRFVPDSPEVSV